MIDTERLLLRTLTSADVDDLVAIHAEPAVSRVIGAADRLEVVRWMECNRHEWDQRGYGRLAIVERRGGRFLGRTGLKYWP
jgi:RimJ/RimL family protein N-acetyltransferase